MILDPERNLAKQLRELADMVEKGDAIAEMYIDIHEPSYMEVLGDVEIYEHRWPRRRESCVKTVRLEIDIKGPVEVQRKDGTWVQY